MHVTWVQPRWGGGPWEGRTLGSHLDARNPPPQRSSAHALLRPASRELTQLRFGLAAAIKLTATPHRAVPTTRAKADGQIFLSCKRNAKDRRSNCAQDQENNLDDTGVVTNLRSQCPEGHGDETEQRQQGVLTSRERITFEASSKAVLLTIVIYI